ncbi:class I SAM-dependent methyltransferase [Hyphomonas sp.]|uniref:class I SAM-dependent methyltransferase n=1 Tax=Hyphomonas sp. TaxID=87 RepID=UPI00391D5627
MIFEYGYPILAAAEHAAASGNEAAMFAKLRQLSLDDFGLLMLTMPAEAFPAMSALLPAMASAEVQRNWTGADGTNLLRQSLTFTRSVRAKYESVTGKPLSGAGILDYGCGYGRLLRLMMYYANNDQLAGCDPWDESIRLCQADGFRCRLDITDYLPAELPYKPGAFDFIYAFSVFTHTSRRASETALAALRKVIARKGLLAITIRPLEYWDIDPNFSKQAASLRQRHREEGFVFMPHNRPAVDGDVTYGDTSMSFDYLDKLARGWKRIGYDRSLDDPYQIIVYLKPA